MSDISALHGFDLQRAALAVVGVSGPEKAVLLVLAMMADKRAQAWPPIGGENGLTAKCCLGERTVQRAIQGLREAGHITRDEKLGCGVVYTVHPRHSGAPATETPRQDDTPATAAATPATAAPKQPVTTKPKKATPSLGKRATKYPANFQPVMSGKTLTTVNGWPPGRLEDELEHFADHHTAKGTTSFDWQASWRTWVTNSKKWEPRNGNGQSNPQLGLRGSRPDPALELLRSGAAQEQAERFGGDQAPDWGAWPALPSSVPS